MAWASPLAWALAAALVLPLVAHLWSRRTPRAMPFPTLRFLRAVSPVSRRLRTVQDWPLLLLRFAIVLAVVAAAAGPTLTTAARLARWQSRLHRIVIVQPELDTPANRAAVDAVIARLSPGSSSTAFVRTGSWEARLAEARRGAATAGEQQRSEVVVLWDGTHRRLTRGDLAAFPATTGLRLESVALPDARVPHFGADGLAAERLVINATDADRDVRMALVASLRAVWPATPSEPVTVYWPGVPLPEQTESSASGGTDRGAVRGASALHTAGLDEVTFLVDDERVRDAASRSVRDARADRFRWPDAARIVARSTDGTPLLRAWHDGARLHLALEAQPSSPLALWAVVAGLDASARPDAWADATPGGRWTDAEVTAANRAPGTPASASLPGGLDTRAAWAFALLLVGVEQWWRRRWQRVVPATTDVSAREVVDDAA